MKTKILTMRKNVSYLFCNGKLLCLSLLCFALCKGLLAQNKASILSESFNGTGMPAGWTVSGLGTTNWSVSATNKAGGSANELNLNYNPSFNGTSRLVLPAVDLTGMSGVVFSFKHCLDNYSGSHTLGIATSSDGGSTWNSGWQQSYTDDGQYAVIKGIETADMGKSNVKFCIYYTGNSYNMDNWYFDDIDISTLESADVKLADILVDDISAECSLPVKFKVLNMGIDTVYSVEVNYQLDTYDIVTETFSGLNVVPFSEKILVFTSAPNVTSGSHTLSVWISKVNGSADAFPDNNSKVKNVSVATQKVPRTILIEHFSSSTCGPCASMNTSMHSLVTSSVNAGKYCYVKYPMSWPGSGDPYYTAEGGVRRTYYGVSGVPSVQWEGGKSTGSPSQSLFNSLYADSAFVNIEGSFNASGKTISVTFNVTPYLSVDDNVRIYVAVCEKSTTRNVGSNGETVFHHIMMKMLPDAQGVDTALVTDQTQTYSYSKDLSSTHVEDMSDLEVAVFVQKYDTKYIFNSKFLDCLCAAPKVTSSSAKVFPNPASTQVQVQGDGIKRVAVFDMLGRMVGDSNFNNVQSCTIGTGDLQNGMYLFRIELVDGSKLQHKVTIAH